MNGSTKAASSAVSTFKCLFNSFRASSTVQGLVLAVRDQRELSCFKQSLSFPGANSYKSMLLTIQRQQTHSSLHIQGSSSLSFAFLEFTSPCFMMANMTPSIRIIAGARTKSALVPRVSASSRTMIVNSLLRRILSNRSTITPSIPVRLAFQTSVQRRSLATQVNGPLYTSQTQMVSYNTSQSRMRKSSRLHFKTNANYFQFSDTTLFTATSRGETIYRQCLLDHGVAKIQCEFEGGIEEKSALLLDIVNSLGNADTHGATQSTPHILFGHAKSRYRETDRQGLYGTSKTSLRE